MDRLNRDSAFMREASASNLMGLPEPVFYESEPEPGHCQRLCTNPAREMKDCGSLYPLLVSLVVLVVGMYFNCCMQVYLQQVTRGSLMPMDMSC